MPKRFPMSTVDTAWLRMDRPTNHMLIVGVLVLERKISIERCRKIIGTRFLSYARFGQRVVMDGDTAYWEDDPHFALTLHVKRGALPDPAGKQELQDFVSDLASAPLDTTRPLWQFHLLDRYGEGCALIARIHHCYADGIALMRVILSLVDEAAASPGARRPAAQVAQPEGNDTLQELFAPVVSTLATTLKWGRELVNVSSEVLLHPTDALDYLLKGVDLTAEAARLAFMPKDSLTRFKGTPAGIKRAAWTNRLPLEEIKAVAHATGCSVNDVVLCCVAGALRNYLAVKGDPVDNIEARALVPMNMRPADEIGSLGNYFGMVAMLLPISIDNPLERLYEVKRRMLELKASPQGLLTLGVLAAAGMAPKLVQQEVLDLLAKRATAVMTNVPGPQYRLHLAQARITELLFCTPQSGDIGMGTSVLSYDGAIQFAVITDSHLVSDPEIITEAFGAEFERLLWLLLMAPWPCADVAGQ